MWSCSLVCVGPGRKPRRQVFHNEAQIPSLSGLVSAFIIFLCGVVVCVFVLFFCVVFFSFFSKKVMWCIHGIPIRRQATILSPIFYILLILQKHKGNDRSPFPPTNLTCHTRRIIVCYRKDESRSRGYKTFYMLNSAEHDIYPAHKC